jgi:hypothetical protein
MPTHADTKTSTHPVKNDGSNHRRPAPKEESCDRSEMCNNEKNACAPINGTSTRWSDASVVFKYHSTTSSNNPFA